MAADVLIQSYVPTNLQSSSTTLYMSITCTTKQKITTSSEAMLM